MDATRPSVLCPQAGIILAPAACGVSVTGRTQLQLSEWPMRVN